ncbi:MAG: rRNA adenine methyltransferase [Ardenticatenaceae bacterium]|nr:hypothetical protein [Anaerolineales bacterium]MCB8984259.1 rRNA adenine methyltransferase [Ardenticatenaceae bacterium]MCB8987496.1 rRNA adenine methyltransferase [Ardenticatenaceae bacterium]
MIPTTAREWERQWAPYDEGTYAEVMEAIHPDDVVLEIGAGDLRLSRRLAEIAHQVIAWEVQASVLFRTAHALPKNLVVCHTDAVREKVPENVSTAVLLMRHCLHFHLYANKLHAAGCQRLITNARWGMGVEVIDLQVPRLLYTASPMGWYACWCGAAGFKAGPAEYLTPELETAVHEVIDCPACRRPLAN